MTSAIKPASTMASLPASTEASKPAKVVTSARSKSNVWKLVPNLTTQEVDNLLEDEEEIYNEINQLEHDVGIIQSVADWHGVNFDSSF